MSRILVLYHSYDDQTQRIARRVADVIREAGHGVEVTRFDGRDIPDLSGFDAVIVGAAIRYGHHDRALERAIKRGAGQLRARPNAFFSVCLSAGGPGRKPEAARRYVDEFCHNTAWEPHEAASFAGALQYSKYGPFIRFMMKLIVGHSGGETDASRDYEYTDWTAVERFARAFGERLSAGDRPQVRAAQFA